MSGFLSLEIEHYKVITKEHYKVITKSRVATGIGMCSTVKRVSLGASAFFFYFYASFIPQILTVL